MNKLTSNLQENKAKEGSVSQKTSRRPLINRNKEVFMVKKTWTSHGELNEIDKMTIESFVENDKIASRIFVTGEVHKDYIGDMASNLLINYNDVLCKKDIMQEPLFVETKNDTIRMCRFNPSFVWRCFHPNILIELLTEEIKRLGLKMDPYMIEHFDFYESMVESIKAENGEYIVPVVQKGGDINTYYNAVYLSCLLLFGKTNFMDIPVAQHFADQSAEVQIKYAKYRKLNVVQQKKVIELREQYGKLKALTNHELLFIISIYTEEKNKKEKEILCY